MPLCCITRVVHIIAKKKITYYHIIKEYSYLYICLFLLQEFLLPLMLLSSNYIHHPESCMARPFGNIRNGLSIISPTFLHSVSLKILSHQCGKYPYCIMLQPSIVVICCYTQAFCFMTTLVHTIFKVHNVCFFFFPQFEFFCRSFALTRKSFMFFKMFVLHL